jgi:hypothetical protein
LNLLRIKAYPENGEPPPPYMEGVEKIAISSTAVWLVGIWRTMRVFLIGFSASPARA